MPPKQRRSPRTPKSRRKSQRRTPDSPESELEEVIAERGEKGDARSKDGAPIDETPHASVLALAKIREALKGLSQEDLQALVKGTPVTRPLQVDNKAAASAALDLAVRVYLHDILDDSTRKLYHSVASDPSNVEDGV